MEEDWLLSPIQCCDRSVEGTLSREMKEKEWPIIRKESKRRATSSESCWRRGLHFSLDS